MKIFRKILDFLFPEKCISCRKEGEIICEICAQKIKCLEKQECPYCRKENLNGELCARLCSEKYYFNYLLVCTRYSASSIIKALMKQFKYKNKKGLYLFFGNILVNQMKLFFKNCNNLTELILIPVPISVQKLKERGYNQCKLIASFCAKTMRLKYAEPLKWTNYKGQQAGKKLEDRIKSRAFTMDIHEKFIHEIRGKTIILIDDIAATCSTVNECARVLKNIGVAKIIVFVISRSNKNLLR